MRQTITKDVEVDVDVYPEDILDDLDQDELKDLGLCRIGSPGGSRHDAECRIFEALDDHHRMHHEAPSMQACTEDPCRGINGHGMNIINEARESHWGRG